MTRLEVFDPPMCCPTGVCGPNVDPALVEFAADLNWLSARQVNVSRYNLAQQPQAFVSNDQVKAALKTTGHTCLPLIFVNGVIVSQGRYPKRNELAAMAGVGQDAHFPLPVLP